MRAIPLEAIQPVFTGQDAIKRSGRQPALQEWQQTAFWPKPYDGRRVRGLEAGEQLSRKLIRRHGVVLGGCRAGTNLRLQRLVQRVRRELLRRLFGDLPEL